MKQTKKTQRKRGERKINNKNKIKPISSKNRSNKKKKNAKNRLNQKRKKK